SRLCPNAWIPTPATPPPMPSFAAARASQPASRPPASISLVVTTCNWKEALALVLASIARQTRLPDEVVIADDGSREDTAALLAAASRGYPVPLRHAWQPDLGFRVGRARNLAIAAARGEYVL